MTYYTTDASGQITAASLSPEFLTDPQQTDEEIVYGYDGQLYLASQCPPTPPEIIQEQLQAEYTGKIQARLDDFARTRGYDGILSVCSYAASLDDNFRREAAYALEARDLTWRRAYEILAEFQGAGKISTWEEIEAELPELAWPEEAAGSVA